MIITAKDKRLFEALKKEHNVLKAYELGGSYTLPVRLVNPKTGRDRLCNLRVKPCNGATNYGSIGLDKGYIHFEWMDHSVNKRSHGMCGAQYFFKHVLQ